VNIVGLFVPWDRAVAEFSHSFGHTPGEKNPQVVLNTTGANRKLRGECSPGLGR
jgi:hypothetical protein